MFSAATKSQTEVTLGDLKLEKDHFKYHRAVKLNQVPAATKPSVRSDLTLRPRCGRCLKSWVYRIKP
jgi:hypothetical protein